MLWGLGCVLLYLVRMSNALVVVQIMEIFLSSTILT